MAITTFSFGNKEITLTTGKANRWEKDGMVRDYIEVIVTGKANPLHKLYEVISGPTADRTVEVAGRTFAYAYGFCDSKTKRRAVDEAVADLVAQISA